LSKRSVCDGPLLRRQSIAPDDVEQAICLHLAANRGGPLASSSPLVSGIGGRRRCQGGGVLGGAIHGNRPNGGGKREANRSLEDTLTHPSTVPVLCLSPLARRQIPRLSHYTETKKRPKDKRDQNGEGAQVPATKGGRPPQAPGSRCHRPRVAEAQASKVHIPHCKFPAKASPPPRSPQASSPANAIKGRRCWLYAGGIPTGVARP